MTTNERIMPAKMELSAKSRVLLLSNAPSIDSDMTAALQSAGCEVILATDHRQALRVARRRRVAVLVLDFGSDFAALLDLASDLRAAARRFRTLALASSLEQLALASEIPAHAVLLKPLTAEQVRNVIGNLLAGLGMQPLSQRGYLEPVPLYEFLSSKHEWEIDG